MSDYHEKPAIGRSGLRSCWNDAELFRKRILGEIPWPPLTPAMAFGSALDFYLTDGTIDPLDGYMIGEWKDWRTKAAKEWRQALVDEGVPLDKILSQTAKTQLLAESEKQMAALMACEKQIRNTFIANEYIFGNADNSMTQYELYAEIDGVDVKSMPDRVIPGVAIVDLKTSNEVDLRHFQQSSHAYWYDVQASLCQMMWEQEANELLPVIFVVVKNQEPHSVEVYEAGDSFIEHGAHRFVDAMEWYKQCLEKDTWVSRTHNKQVTLEAPKWWMNSHYEAMELAEV